MAVRSKECEQMIAAARRNDVRLMIGYRLHFEPANLEAIALVRSGQIGEPRLFTSTFSMEVRPGNVRLEHEMGGGPLYDIGIYCINAARYIFGSEPTEVFAVTVGGHDRRFHEVEEGASVTLHFPDDRLASFSCSFGASDVSSYRVVGTKGDLSVEPAYEYQEALVHRLTRNGGVKRRRFARRDQFAPELLHLSECIRKNSDPEPSGEEGLVDVLILEGISQSARTGRRVALDLPRRMQRPSLRLERSRPPVKKPRLVEVESASR
jgi:glucose-fructose oxidoreductase